MMKRRPLKGNGDFYRSESEEFAFQVTPKRRDKFLMLTAKKSTKETISLLVALTCILVFGIMHNVSPPKPIIEQPSVSLPPERNLERKHNESLTIIPNKVREGKEKKTCVITTSVLNRLGFVLHLYESVMKHNPNIDCFVWFMIDDPKPKFAESWHAISEMRKNIKSKKNFVFLTPTDIEKKLKHFEYKEYCFINDSVSFQAISLPFAFEYAFEELKIDSAIFLSTDFLVTGSFQEIQHELSKYSVLLTPHIIEPNSLGRKNPHAQQILQKGPLNTDFMAFRDTPSTRKFIRFWEEQIIQRSSIKTPKDVLPFVVDLLDTNEILILRDHRYNVASWNLSEREAGLQFTDGALYIQNPKTKIPEKVIFMNFSDMPILKEDYIANNSIIKDHPQLKNVMVQYLLSLSSVNVLKYYKLPYGFDKFNNGIEIKPWMRKYYEAASFSTQSFDSLTANDASDSKVTANVYLRSSFRNEVDWQNPFCCTKECLTDKTKQSFLQWTISATPDWAIDLTGSFFFSPIEKHVWESRPDLQAAYPQPQGEDHGRFKEWFIENGVNEGVLDRKLFDMWLRVWKYHKKHHSKFHKSFKNSDDIGVNIYGWFGGQFSIGIVAQKYLSSIQKSGLPHNAIGSNFMPDGLSFVSPSSIGIQTTRSLSEIFNIVVMNADTTDIFLREIPQEIREQKYNIAIWFWELDVFPENWMHWLQSYDEIWVTTKFGKKAIENSKLYDKTLVQILPIPNDTTNSHASTEGGENKPKQKLPSMLRKNDRGRESEKPFVFLVVFDFKSFAERKNPAASIRAFVDAFPLSEDPNGEKHQLIMKSHSGTEEQMGELHEVAENDPRVIFINSVISWEENVALHEYQDCQVSLHRSEGYGMNILESMASGIPVIATNYSGNVDFFENMPDLINKCAFPVQYKLIELKESYGPYVKGNHWADPDHNSAVLAMRTAARNECKKSGLSKKMIEEVRGMYGYEAIGKQMKSMLVEAVPRMQEKLKNKSQSAK